MLDLIERLEKAESGSFELEHQIAEAVYPHLAGFRLPDGNGWSGPGWTTRAPPPYTVSLDAIVALIGEKLPNQFWAITEHPDGFAATIGGLYHSQVKGVSLYTAPLALCIALLRALHTQEQRHDQ